MVTEENQANPRTGEKRFRLASEPLRTRSASTAPFEPALFGGRVEEVKRSGKNAKLIAIPSKRVYATTKDGHSLELYAVFESGRANRRVIGFFTVVDGKLRQTNELSYDGQNKKPSTIRTILRDEKGALTQDVSADVRTLELEEEKSRLSQADRIDSQRMFGRLMHGLASLVLPDQLHAATTRSSTA